MPDSKINRQIESETHKKVDLMNVWNESKTLKGKLEIVRFEPSSKDRHNCAALMSYGKQFHIAGASQRTALDPIFVRDEQGSSGLSSDEDLSSRRKILLVMQVLRYVGSPNFRSLYVEVATLCAT